MVQSKSSANIMETIYKNNKKTENFQFLLKNSCIWVLLGMKKRYFS